MITGMEEAPVTVEQLLDDARRRLARLTSEAGREAVEHRAILVNIRSDAQRARHGVVPGARGVL